METTPNDTDPNTRLFRFFCAGGVEQVRMDTGATLAAISKLDQKLWVALSCPVTGLEFDERTLELIDGEKDGRVRAPEVIAAVNWAVANLKTPDELTRELSALPLASINDATAEGKQLLASAKQILANLGKPDAATITVDDTADVAKIFGQTRFNGDGIITPESAADAATKQVITEIIGTHGSVPDRSGVPGISQSIVDAFFADAAAFAGWNKKSESEAATISPLGENMPAAYGTFKAVQAKIEDFFARVRLAAFDPRATAAVNRQEADFLALAQKDLTLSSGDIANFPLARVEPNKALPLRDGVNPAWADLLAEFNQAVIAPLLGRDKTSLTEAEWKTVKSKLAAYENWLEAKSGVPVEKLGLKRVREILAGQAKEELNRLIGEDKKLESESNTIASVEKLVRYYRDLHRLTVNFISFQDFYGRKRKSIFQVGTLFLDGRSCDLCVRVEDAGKHAALAGLAGMYLVYCECSRAGEKLTIAAAFTDGDADNLMIGRNGIFYDRKGRDWDATIMKIIDNPISIREAFWSPYKKLVRLVEEQVAKRAAQEDNSAVTNLTSAASVAPAPQPAAEPKRIDAGTVAALGVALGFLTTAAATIFAKATGLMVLPFWQICLVFAGLLLCVSGPAMLIAWLKLRQRNLGPILDANGWAVNGRMKVNVPLGRSLTQVAKLPPGARATADDPFAQAPSLWPKLAATVVVICFVLSFLNYYGAFNGLKQKFGIDQPSAGQTNQVPVNVSGPLITNSPAAKAPSTNAPANVPASNSPAVGKTT